MLAAGAGSVETLRLPDFRGTGAGKGQAVCMGHERVGILPKSARWTRLVHQMGGVFASEVPVGALAAQTLQNVRRQETLFQDDAVKSAFTFPVKFSHAWRLVKEPSHGRLVCTDPA